MTDEALHTLARAAGPALEEHARFETLHAQFVKQNPALWHWYAWPEELRSPRAAGVQAFVRDHA